jgi:aspartate/methionine/tyrosine aminotransferase
MMLTMLGISCLPLICRPEDGYVPDIATASGLMSSRTRAILLISPNNPTGATYPPATIAAFANLCRQRGIWLILDETYRDFLPEHHDRPHELFADPDWGDTVIGLTSFSKAYAMPGWRLGAMMFGQRIRPEIGKLLDCIQICPARAGQVALAATLEQLGPWRREMRSIINARCEAFRAAMAGVNGWQVEQTGAYFAYLRHPFADVPAAAVARRLSQERGIMTLPAPVFGPGQEQRLRIAIANADLDVIAKIPDRLRSFA